MRLTDSAVRAAQPRATAWKLSDGRGLYLLVTSTGSRLWRLKYYFARREKLLALGVYPEMSLKQARDARDDARRSLRMGVDPAAARRAAKEATSQTFEGIAREWLETQRRKPKATTYEKKLQWLTELAFPSIGSMPITSVTGQDVLALLRKIEGRGLNETAHRVRSLCGNVFRFAMATGRTQGDVTAVLRGALAPVVTRNRSAITYPARVGDLMRAIDAYRGQPTTRAALRLAPLTFVRPGELRFAE